MTVAKSYKANLVWPEGFRPIPGFSSYAVNAQGVVINRFLQEVTIRGKSCLLNDDNKKVRQVAISRLLSVVWADEVNIPIATCYDCDRVSIPFHCPECWEKHHKRAGNDDN